MKWFKRSIIGILTIGILYLAVYKPNGLNLQGTWETKQIILDGREKYPDNIARYISFPTEIVIDHWSKSMYISLDRKTIEAQFRYLESNGLAHKIRLSSNEKSLNGIFDVTIDTIDVRHRLYTVVVELTSDSTVISFQKHVYIRPWDPGPLPRGVPY